MQLFASEDSKYAPIQSPDAVISASRAVKQRDYFCIECGKVVRLRGGIHRQDHFYHVQPNFACRQSQKSLEHLQTQWFLGNQFPEGEWEIEKAFPEISRIADFVWEAKKWVFEVQCSPITSLEVEERNRDYGSLGYRVIWIFHEDRFNRFKVSSAELFLKKENALYFFTNMDAEGNGKIYDQIQLIYEGRRRFKRKGKEILLSEPKFHGDMLYFSGDFTDRLQKKDPITEVFFQEYQKAKRELFNHEALWKKWYKYFFRFQRNAFYLFLQRCSNR